MYDIYGHVWACSTNRFSHLSKCTDLLNIFFLKKEENQISIFFTGMRKIDHISPAWRTCRPFIEYSRGVRPISTLSKNIVNLNHEEHKRATQIGRQAIFNHNATHPGTRNLASARPEELIESHRFSIKSFFFSANK